MSERSEAVQPGHGHRVGRVIDPSMVERAKGAVMLDCGVGSPEALALLLRWAADAGTDVRELSELLVLGVWHREPQVIAQDPLRVRWLQARLHAMQSDPRPG